MMTYQKTKFDDAFDLLMDAFELKGESGTEQLYYFLRNMVDELEGTIEESHQEGLCYNMAAAMAGTLQQYHDKAQPTLRMNH